MKIPTHYNVDSVKSVCFFALNHDVLSLCHLKLCNVCDIVFDKMQRVFAKCIARLASTVNAGSDRCVPAYACLCLYGSPFSFPHHGMPLESSSVFVLHTVIILWLAVAR